MQWLQKGLAVILAIAAVAIGALFSLQNTQSVPLDLIVLKLPPQPIAIWILSSLASGVLIGLSSGAWLALRRAATIRRLRKQRDRLLLATGKTVQNAPQ
ncbi:MAG: hypothetical protein CME57_04075 [Halieaceae bacterium]|nr:hypothetical protein [Halieaceae bacterium]